MKPSTTKLTSSLAVFLLLAAAQIASAFYDPSLGRWLTRDPVQDQGFEMPRGGASSRPGDGLNLFGFLENDTMNGVDAFGLATIPKGAESCFGAHPLYPDDPACDKYGEREYRGVKLRCFCKCPMLRDPWSLYVRGCLRCMDEKGVPVDDAHEACYESADKNYTRPTGALAACFCHCR